MVCNNLLVGIKNFMAYNLESQKIFTKKKKIKKLLKFNNFPKEVEESNTDNS